MVGEVPRERALLEDVPQPGLVREEEGEVGGQDAVLDVAQDLAVLLRIQAAEDVVVLLEK